MPIKDTVTSRVHPKKEKKIYTDSELKEFDDFLQKYKNNKYVMQNGEEIIRYNWEQVYIDLEVKNKNGGVYVNNAEYGLNRVGEWHMMKNEIPLIELDEKIEQWKFWKEKKGYSEYKKLEYWDQVKQISDKFNEI